MDYPAKRAYYENENNNNAKEPCYALGHIDAVYTNDDETETLGIKLNDIDGKIGDLTGVGLTETDLATAIKNDRISLSEKANDTDSSRTTTNKTITGAINELNSNKVNQSDFNATNTNVSNNTSQLANQASQISALQSKKITESDCSDSLISAIAGTASINSTPADYSLIPRKNKYPMVQGTASKNLFDLRDITTGYYVLYTNGNLVANVNYCASNYIPVIPSTTYYISGTTEQLAFYDINKAYISGVTFAGAITTPSNAYYVRISMLITQLSSVQIEQNVSATSYESFYPKIDSTLIKNRLSESVLDLSLLRGVTSRNLFNKTTVTSGKYVKSTDGTLGTSANYYASDYITISSSTAYVVSGTSEQCAFYDSNKNYISGLTWTSSSFTTPSNAYYIRLSMQSSQINSVQLETGNTPNNYEPYGSVLPTSYIRGLSLPTVNTITVKTDGTGNFTDPVSATNSITNSSANNIYNVYIYSGIYDIISLLGGDTFLATITDTSNQRAGWVLPDYVNLIGVGNVTLKGYISDTQATNNLNVTSCVSTINIWKNNILKNLNITAYNMRYAVHDECNNAFSNYQRDIEDCTFIHTGVISSGWRYYTAYAVGTGSGAQFKIKNSIFQSAFTGFSAHNNTGFVDKNIMEFNNCKFINSSYPNGSGSVQYAFRLGSMGSGQQDQAILNNCDFVGYFSTMEEVTGKGNDWYVKGGGNNFAPYSHVNTVGSVIRNEFTGEVSTYLNTGSTTISKGTPVKIINGGIQALGNNEQYLFYGIAWEDIPINSYGLVKFAGYIAVSDTLLSSITTGNKIIVNSSGALEVNTNGDAIGIATSSNYILLK